MPDIKTEKVELTAEEKREMQEETRSWKKFIAMLISKDALIEHSGPQTGKSKKL